MGPTAVFEAGGEVQSLRRHRHGGLHTGYPRTDSTHTTTLPLRTRRAPVLSGAGWALPREYIASCLTRNPSEFVTDPWVSERQTLVALKNDRLCAAVHLLEYEADSPACGAGEVDWFVCWPRESCVGAELLSAAVEVLDVWQVQEPTLGVNFPVPIVAGVPESWSHIVELFDGVGYAPRDEQNEAIFGGMLDSASGSALWKAAAQGHLEIATMLLEAGADPNAWIVRRVQGSLRADRYC